MKLAGLILAGGRSQRMGQDKALLELEGVPLLRRTWNIAQALTEQVWVVTAWRDRYAPYLPATAQWILEAPTARVPAGPLVAFAHALPQIDADWILLLACDLPALKLAVLQQWEQHLPQVPATAIAYLPHPLAGWEPLCGFYRMDCLASLSRYVNSGGRSFQGWLQQQVVEPIADVPAEMLVNCNTPEDWAQFRDRRISH